MAMHPAKAVLFEMEGDVLDTVRLIWAAVTIADHGERHGLSQQDLGALNTLLRFAHDRALAIRDAREAGWEASCGS